MTALLFYSLPRIVINQIFKDFGFGFETQKYLF